jgi:putative RNA 2'-phosphotransferase
LHILHGLPNFRWATRADVEAAIALPGRRRFEIVGDAGDARIRALYGHTAIRPTYPPVAPPDVLYHGTAPETLAAIRREGLKPMERQYVHLAIDPETARDIAIRHTDTPAILCVAAAAAYAAGVRFYHPVEQIYLSDPIPPQYVAL